MVYEYILMYTGGIISHGQVELRQIFSCFIRPSSTNIYIQRRMQCLRLSEDSFGLIQTEYTMCGAQRAQGQSFRGATRNAVR